MYVNVNVKDTIFWLSPFDWVMQLNWLYSCGICQLIPLKTVAEHSARLQPSINLQLQPLCSAALVPTPGGMKARVSPVQWSKPHSILAPTQDSNPGGRIQKNKRWPLHTWKQEDLGITYEEVESILRRKGQCRKIFLSKVSNNTKCTRFLFHFVWPGWGVAKRDRSHEDRERRSTFGDRHSERNSWLRPGTKPNNSSCWEKIWKSKPTWRKQRPKMPNHERKRSCWKREKRWRHWKVGTRILANLWKLCTLESHYNTGLCYATNVL